MRALLGTWPRGLGLIKFTIITNFLAFLLLLFLNFLPSGFGLGSRRENECGSGSTALQKTTKEAQAVGKMTAVLTLQLLSRLLLPE